MYPEGSKCMPYWLQMIMSHKWTYDDLPDDVKLQLAVTRELEYDPGGYLIDVDNNPAVLHTSKGGLQALDDMMGNT